MVKYYNMKNKERWIDDIKTLEEKLCITMGRYTDEELKEMDMIELERKKGMLLALWNQQNPTI